MGLLRTPSKRREAPSQEQPDSFDLLSDEELRAGPKFRVWAGAGTVRTQQESADELRAAPDKVWAGSEDQRSAQERADELVLADGISPLPHTSALAGWAAGRRQRLVLAVVLLSLLPLSLVAYRQIKLRVRAQRVAAWQPSAETAGAPRGREMTWSGGFARLGLERSWPGVLVVHLPDRDIVLEDGHDRAIFAVDVVDGATTYIKVTHGAVRQVAPGSYRPDAIHHLTVSLTSP